MTNRDDVQALLTRLVAREVGCPVEKVDLSRSPESLGIDSLTRLQILVDIEEALDIQMPDRGLSADQSFTDLLDTIQSVVEARQ